MPSSIAENEVTDRCAWDDATVWEGITSLLDRYAHAQPDDVFVVAYAVDSREAAARVLVALEARGVDTRRVWMAPLRDEGFGDRIQAVLPNPASLPGRLVVLTLERDTMSHDSVFDAVLSGYKAGQTALIRVISVCPELFGGPLRVSPVQLASRNAFLLERLTAASALAIRTPGGTDLTVALDNTRYKWLNNHGMLRPGRPLFLPPGEVATFPASIDGVLVADFAYNVNKVTESDVRLHAHPVTVTIRNGRAVNHECADSKVSEFVDRCFGEHPSAVVVGELGFGTNAGVDSAVPLNSHINERRPGVHLGFGEHNQSLNVVDYSCRVHLDLIARGGTVWVDDDEIPLGLEGHPVTMDHQGF